MAYRDWAGVAAGVLLAVACAALLAFRAPDAVAYAALLAGATLIVITWPAATARVQPPDDTVDSWARLRTEMGLHGPVAGAQGRLFLSAKPSTVAPLDDGRTVYDGADGFAAGLAFTHPLAGTLTRWLAADPQRLRSSATLEEDLAALGQATGWFTGLRLLAEPAGLRIRFRSDVPGEAVEWLLLGATGRATGKSVALLACRTEAQEREAHLGWVTN